MVRCNNPRKCGRRSGSVGQSKRWGERAVTVKTVGAAGVNLGCRSATIPQESTKNNPKERAKGGGEYGECPPEGAKKKERRG